MAELTSMSESRARWRAWFEVMLIFAVFFIHAGYPVPDDNEPHYLCKAKHYWNPSYGANDFFINSADAHVVFYWTFGWVTKFVSLSAAAWIGRVVTWLALAWAWRRLSWRFAPWPYVSVLSAALFVTFIGRFHLAGEWVVGGVEAKGFAYVFVLIALERAFANRWNAAWIALGAATAFHVLVGGWAVIALGISWSIIACRNREDIPLQFFAMLPGLVVGAGISLVGVLPALSLTRGSDARVATDAAEVYVFERLPHHLAILHLRGDELLRRVARHVGLYCAMLALLQALRKLSAPNGSPALVSESNQRLVATFASVAFGFATCGFAIEFAAWSAPEFGATWLRFYWFRLTDFAVPLAAALLAGALVAVTVRLSKRAHVVYLTVALGLAGWHLADVMNARRIDPRPRGDMRLAQNGDGQDIAESEACWIDVCRYIRERTPPDALFLTPRHSQTFKWRTGRGEVVNRKDIPQDAAGIVEWARRMARVHQYEDDEGETRRFESLAAAGDEHIAALQKEFDFDYVLTRSRPVLRAPRVYGNQRFAVYAVKKRKSQEAAPPRK